MPTESNLAAPETGVIGTENRPRLPSTPNPTISTRNKELLALRDTVLLAACRIAGSLPNAEDVVQEAYIRAVQVREPLLSGTDLRNWFLKITVNAARDFLRSEKSRKARERKVAMQIFPSNSSPANSSSDPDLKERLEFELAKLDEKYRTPISFHYEQGLTYDEAAYVLDVPAGTLRWQASEGIKILRERLGHPSKPVSAEILIAALAAGAAFKCSPALAASAEAIVAKSTVPALKVFSMAAAKSAWMALTLKTAAGVAALLAVGWLAVEGLNLGHSAGTNTAANPQPAESDAAPDAAQKPEGSVKPPEAVLNWVQNPNEAVVPPPPKAVNYTPPPEVEARWNEAIDLFPLIDPERDAVVGKWTFNEKGLAVAAEKCSRLAIPYQPPEEYDFRADFTRETNGFDINLIFSISGQNHLWMMDSWSACGFGGTYQNPDAVPTPGIANNVRHTVIVEVRKDSLKAFLDGRMLKSIVLWKAASLVTPDWRLPDESLVGIGAWNSGMVFHRIAIREVTGKGKLPDADPGAANAVLAEYWKDAIDVAPKAVNQQNIVAGKWAVAQGELKCAPGQGARIHLGYIPPEEYDFKLVFTRGSGEDEIAQIVSAAGRQFVWKVDCKQFCELDTIDGQNHSEHAVTLHTPGIAAVGKTVTSIVCVRKDGIRVYIDGKLLANWRTHFFDMGIEKSWQLPSLETIGVGASMSDVKFQKIQIKEITGTGKKYIAPAGGNADQF